MRNRSKYLTAIFGGVFMVCGMGSALTATYTVTKTADTNDGRSKKSSRRGHAQ